MEWRRPEKRSWWHLGFSGPKGFSVHGEFTFKMLKDDTIESRGEGNIM